MPVSPPVFAPPDRPALAPPGRRGRCALAVFTVCAAFALGRPGGGPAAAQEGADGAAETTTLLRVGTFVVRVGEAERAAYRAEPGRLFRRDEQGVEQRVGVSAVGRPVGDPIAGGVRIDGHVRYGVEIETDTFGEVPDAALPSLRCVRLVRPNEAQRARLARLDPSTVVFVDGGAARDEFPWLPPSARHVVLGGGLEGRGPAELADLVDYASLTTLVLGSNDATTDLHPLARLPRLQVLDLSGRDVLHLRPLARCVDLRRLDAAGCFAVRDLAPLAMCRHLVHVDVSFTDVADLSPLSGLPALHTLAAVGAPVTQLPSGPLPALRSLRLLGTAMTRDAVLAFAQAHPACDVVADAASSLRPVLARIDRIRIRTGGTCHRVAPRERTLAVVTEPTAIDAFVACLRFAEPEFDESDLDCASTTFEAMHGERLVASLALHKGALLRFEGSGWPGDARLSDEGADALVAWAASLGVVTPQAERAFLLRRTAADLEREARWAALLPADLETRLEQASMDHNDGGELLAPRSLLPARRLALALSVLGAGTTSASRVPTAASAVLLEASPEELHTATNAAMNDLEQTIGLARWLLDVPSARGRFSADRLDALLPRWLDPLFADPRPEVASDGVALAALLRRPAALDRLVRLVVGRTSLLAEDDTGDPFARAETLRALDALSEADEATAVRLSPVVEAWSSPVRARYQQRRIRTSVVRALLPPGLPDLLHLERVSGKDAGTLFVRHHTDPSHRARVALALLAIEDNLHDASASSRAADEALRLDPLPALRAAAAPDAPEVIVLGATRWLLAWGGDATGREAERDAVLRRGVPRLLAESEPPDRISVVSALARQDGEATRAILKDLLRHASPDVAFAAAQAMVYGEAPDLPALRDVLPRLAPPERAWLEERLP